MIHLTTAEAKRSIANSGTEIVREGREVVAKSPKENRRNTNAIASGSILTKITRSMTESITGAIVGARTNVTVEVGKD
jgi:hypothetical protein